MLRSSDGTPIRIAILRDSETVYRATSSQDSAPLYSAPVALVQAIYDLKPEQARRITRQRIYTTLAPSESIAGIVKVAAKRIDYSLSINDDSLKTDNASNIVDVSAESIWRPDSLSLPIETWSSTSSRSDAEWMEIAQALAKQVDRRGPCYASDRPIAAILVSSENKILAAAVNTNAQNRTLHAEMNLIASLPDFRIPPGSRLFATLKPCKMCAGMIVDSAEDLQNLKVIFAEDDPGPRARNTALDRCVHAVQSQLSLS